MQSILRVSIVVLIFLVGVGLLGYGAKITIDNASGIWEKQFVYPTEVLSIATGVEVRILAEYATTLFEADIVYPGPLLAQSSIVPDRIVVEYASSIATFDLVNSDLAADRELEG